MTTNSANPAPDPPNAVHMEPDDYATKKLTSGKLLWHYTRDFNGLKGILGGELWASSLLYLNDTEEFRYGVRVALNTIKPMFDNSEHLNRVWTSVEDFLLNRYKADDLFSISFSTEDDDLSQWRAYSGSGPSFSLGFEPKKLESQAIGYLFQLYEVRYRELLNEEDVTEELQEEVYRLDDAASAKDAHTSPEEFAREQGPIFARAIMQIAPRYKHPKFAAEKEWRLIRRMPVLTPRPWLPRQFRVSGSLVVPYVAMPLHVPQSEAAVYAGEEHVATSVSAITIGPSPHKEELKRAVESMTARLGLALIDVKSSAVPFRNW
jgi:hypothetical protein